jgi:hypothetical protein
LGQRLLFCALLYLIPGLNDAASAQTPIGCLEQPLADCMKFLAPTFGIGAPQIEAETKRLAQVDVNGRKIAATRSVSLTGQVPESRLGAVNIDIFFDQRMIVRQVSATLPQDLWYAKTEADYDKSGLWPVTAHIVGLSCPDLSKISLYRFFENNVKPKIKKK